MADATGRPTLLDRVRALSHPRLVATTALGVVLLAVAFAVYGPDPTLGVRVGFVGAVLVLVGVSGYIAFTVDDAAHRRR